MFPRTGVGVCGDDYTRKKGDNPSGEDPGTCIPDVDGADNQSTDRLPDKDKEDNLNTDKQLDRNKADDSSTGRRPNRDVANNRSTS